MWKERNNGAQQSTLTLEGIQGEGSLALKAGTEKYTGN